MIRSPLLLIIPCAFLLAQAQKPLDSAYAALHVRSYEAAIDLFHQSITAEHFEKAFQLKPDLRSLLLDLARIWKAQGRIEDSTAALLAASRGGEPRTAEAARELLPARYPYVYEFRCALAIDPKNIELRR